MSIFCTIFQASCLMMCHAPLCTVHTNGGMIASNYRQHLLSLIHPYPSMIHFFYCSLFHFISSHFSSVYFHHILSYTFLLYHILILFEITTITTELDGAQSLSRYGQVKKRRVEDSSNLQSRVLPCHVYLA